MGCIQSQSREARYANERSNQIDRMLKDSGRESKREAKILLLGGGESGKSTIVKQMKIIHQNGYSQEELLAFKPTILRNISDSVIAIIRGVDGLGLEYGIPDNQIFSQRLLQPKHELDEWLLPENAAYIISIWNDPVCQQVIDAQHPDYYVIDSAPYFFENIQRIAEPGYTPSEQDVLRSRNKTEGMLETWFTMGTLRIHMFDVGGQRSERRKWIHCFENVTSIIFCVALSEYDQTLLEEPTQNRMMESLTLFESVVNSRWFLRTSIILFLNKVDLFREKLPRIPLAKFFAEYTGGSDVNSAAKFILWRFSQTNRANLNIYPHLTQATDTNNIRVVFAAVKVTVLQNALKDNGIL
ncbi:hypothetical protein SeLEV6574_g03492 [Synchytrium endobioticum]|uniref:Uncharacterized protein n=1 Tax=Synchytrium endobioticum TaxID=286115 RepID=A0A507D413_9FUNG|nr:hypothetical protein SeLEV6574_g03492 [Synchytrium endobioticum]